MTKEQLINYLRDIVNMESKKQIMVETYNSYKQKKETLYRIINYQPTDTSKDSDCKIQISYVIGFIILTIVLSLIISLGGFIIGMIILIRYLTETSKNKKTAKEKYDRVFVAAQRQSEVSRAAVILINNDLEKLHDSYNKADEVVQKLYGVNLIYPKYRNLAACAMFLEYLESGRCETLEGPFGAMNKYEEEKDRRIIICNLQQINQKLDQIQKNQRILYYEMQKINSQVEELCETTQNIEKYSKQAANNTKVSAWCDMINTYNINEMKKAASYYS